MPRSAVVRLAAVCAVASLLSLSFAAVSFGKSVSADLRVVGKGGKVLAEKTLATDTVAIKTSKKADCFGADNAGSGASVTVKGATAMGLLADAAKSTPSLRPMLVTDAFDFGLGICGIGNSVVSGTASWYLKVNHKGAMVGGDSVKLRAGDEVLWTLAPSYPYPDELVLVAPARVSAGKAFQARVFAYDEKGKKKPVAGAKVSGVKGTTGSDGRISVTLSGPRKLRASHGKDIPSAAVAVCVGGKCPAGS